MDCVSAAVTIFDGILLGVYKSHAKPKERVKTVDNSLISWRKCLGFCSASPHRVPKIVMNYPQIVTLECSDP
jgi:hypothetical protein